MNSYFVTVLLYILNEAWVAQARMFYTIIEMWNKYHYHESR